MEKAEREKIRAMVRTLYDYQDMRLRTAGRLRLKADDSYQTEENQSVPVMVDREIPALVDIKDETREIENRLAKAIKKEIESLPIWEAFFDGVKGCGPLMAAACIAEFDIERATTVSKMWQFAGLNPGEVRAKKIEKVTKKTDTSKAIRTFENAKGEKCMIVESEIMVRGDRLTPGCVAPYNSWLRTKLVGVLAGCMIKCQSSYALDFYYPYKARLEQEQNCITGTDKKWAEESKGHRDMAAKRYMIKQFLKDLYVAWRTLEGLPVREPYQVEYLGKRHSA